jgi:hypothetical protein
MTQPQTPDGAGRPMATDQQLDDLIGTHVEEAVRAMRAASPAPTSPVA